MKLYDTHAHVYAEEYGDRAEQLLGSFGEAGITVNNIGTGHDTSLACVETAQRYPGIVRAVVGLHPFDIEKEKFDAAFYRDLAANPEVVGMGECGLDYSRLPAEADRVDGVKSVQLDVFRQQVEIARELGKVLVIHCRPTTARSEDAYEDLLVDLRARHAAGTLPRFVVHSFTASVEICQKFLDLGGYIAFNGILTFDKTGKLAEAVGACPLDRLLIETDAPYLAPVPFRGKQNEPAYVQYVAEKVAEIKKLTTEEVAEATLQNGLRLFK